MTDSHASRDIDPSDSSDLKLKASTHTLSHSIPFTVTITIAVILPYHADR